MKKFLLSAVFLILYPLGVLAQIIPDNTLGTENSTINSIDNLQDVVEGGAVRGNITLNTQNLRLL